MKVLETLIGTIPFIELYLIVKLNILRHRYEI